MKKYIFISVCLILIISCKNNPKYVGLDLYNESGVNFYTEDGEINLPQKKIILESQNILKDFNDEINDLNVFIINDDLYDLVQTDQFKEYLYEMIINNKNIEENLKQEAYRIALTQITKEFTDLMITNRGNEVINIPFANVLLYKKNADIGSELSIFRDLLFISAYNNNSRIFLTSENDIQKQRLLLRYYTIYSELYYIKKKKKRGKGISDEEFTSYFEVMNDHILNNANLPDGNDYFESSDIDRLYKSRFASIEYIFARYIFNSHSIDENKRFFLTLLKGDNSTVIDYFSEQRILLIFEMLNNWGYFGD